MERAGSDLTAFGETVVFLDYFKDLPDPRQAGKVIYPLPEVLLLCLLAVLAGAETFVDIARFGEKKIKLLRRFRPFRHGTPAHDHLGDILSVLDAEQFQRCFVDWVAALTGALFAFAALPPSQWKSARTTNAIERLHEEFKRRIKTQTVLPSADTAAMLFWALLASGQIVMRKIDGWNTLSTVSSDQQKLDAAA